MRAAHLLYRLAGEPDLPRPLRHAPGSTCCVCAEPIEEGIRSSDALGKNFDISSLADPSSDLTCGPCAWAIAGKPPNTLRMWTIVARQDRPVSPSHEKCTLDLGPHIHLTARDDMREVVSILLDPPDSEWVCTVAVSGQKHVVPYAVANSGRRWTVRMEVLDVQSDSDAFAEVLFHAASLRALGFTGDDIASGEPAIHRLTRDTLPAWLHHQEALRSRRGGGLLDLALTCITKDRIDEYRDRAAAALGVRPDDIGNAPRTRFDEISGSGRDRPAGLVEASEDRAGNSGSGSQRVAGAGLGDGAGAPDRRPPPGLHQLDLFDR